MDGVVHMRRLAGYGWSIETSGGVVRAVKRDDATVMPVVHRLMGTSEAAQFLGVRPPNFVRDWASRADFPAPLAALSSGRVWLAADVEHYATTRRSPRPRDERINEIARRIVWWQKPAQTLERRSDFVARVMATGSLDEVRDVELYFGIRVLQEAVVTASAGIFDRRAWNYWRLVLGLDRATPPPIRHTP